MFRLSIKLTFFSLFITTIMFSTFAARAPEPLHYLFVLSAEQGHIIQLHHKYQLVLTKLDPNVLWFTDRPNRKAGFVTLANFIERWHIGFKNIPPNVGLVHIDMSYQYANQQQPLALEASQPRLINNKLIFKIKSLIKHQQLKTQQLKNIKLFIDPPAARLLDFHQMPLATPQLNITIEQTD